jgi:hypothetical protein
MAFWSGNSGILDYCFDLIISQGGAQANNGRGKKVDYSLSHHAEF